jgi:hypothetical protein
LPIPQRLSGRIGRHRIQDPKGLAWIFHTPAGRFINTVASARCKRALRALQPFQRFGKERGKPLSRLGRLAAYVHRAEAAVLMGRAAGLRHVQARRSAERTAAAPLRSTVGGSSHAASFGPRTSDFGFQGCASGSASVAQVWSSPAPAPRPQAHDSVAKGRFVGQSRGK